jgi:hypothetical protein
MSEHRAHPRYAHEVDCTVRHGERTIPARSRDVSRGGLCLASPTPIPLGAEVTMSIALVFDEQTFSEPLALRARVVWCTQIGGMHQIGTSFIGLTAEGRHYLEMFLRYLKEGQRREADANGGGEPDDPFG